MSPKTADHANDGSRSKFRSVDLEDVLDREGLKVEAVRRVVVRGDGLRVAVHHDGLVPGLMKCHNGMHAGVVELDSLTNPVRAGAENKHSWLVAGWHLCFVLVCRVQIRCVRFELGGAGVDRLEDRMHPKFATELRHHRGVQAPNRRDLLVRQAMPLSSNHHLGGECWRGSNLPRHIQDHLKLVEEPGVDPCGIVELFHCCPCSERLHYQLEPPIERSADQVQEILDITLNRRDEVESGARILQRAQRLPKGLCEVAANPHRLPHRLHMGCQIGVCLGEFLKGEARRLHHHVVQGWFERGRSCARDFVGYFVQCVANRDFGRDLSNRVSGRLRCKG